MKMQAFVMTMAPNSSGSSTRRCNKPLLNLQIPAGSGDDPLLLDALLHNNLSSVELDASNLNDCDGCKLKVRGVNSRIIVLPPPVLILTLQRFLNDGSKANNRLFFPRRLYLTPFVMFTAAQIDAARAAGATIVRQVVHGKDVESVELYYTLGGMVQHEGTRAGGHYWAFGRSLDPIAAAGADDWRKYNDPFVTRCDYADVEGGQAYMLRYDIEPQLQRILDAIKNAPIVVD